MGWLVDSLVSWLVGRLAGLFVVGWFVVDWLIGFLHDCTAKLVEFVLSPASTGSSLKQQNGPIQTNPEVCSLLTVPRMNKRKCNSVLFKYMLVTSIVFPRCPQSST